MKKTMEKIKEKKILKILIISVLISFFIELFIFNINTVVNEIYNEELVVLNTKNLKYGNGYYVTEKKNSYIILKNNKKNINKISFEYETNKDVKYDIVTKNSKVHHEVSNNIDKTTRKIKVNSKENIKIIFHNKDIKLRNFRASNELLINNCRLLFMIFTIFTTIILVKYYKWFIKRKEILFLLIGSLYGIILTITYPISTIKENEINSNQEIKYKSYEEMVSYNNLINNKEIKISNEYNNEKVYKPYTIMSKVTNSLGMKETTTVILMRLLNLIIYLSLVCIALKITPYLEKLTFVIGLLPSSIGLVNHLSYYSLSVASMILGFAALLKLKSERKINNKYLLIFILGTSIASIINPIYSPMFLLILSLKDKVYKDEKMSKRIKILSIILFIIALSSILFYFINYKASKGINILGQINFIIKNPINYFILLAKMFIYNVSEMFFGYNTLSLMGLFNNNMPQFNLSNFILLALILYLVYKEYIPRELSSKKMKQLLAIILLIIWILIWTFSYLTLTPVGNTEILGVVNVIFIPLIIPFILIFMNKNKEEIKNKTIIYLIPVIVLIYSISQVVFCIYK